MNSTKINRETESTYNWTGHWGIEGYDLKSDMETLIRKNNHEKDEKRGELPQQIIRRLKSHKNNTGIRKK